MAREQADRCHAPRARPRDLRLRAGRRDRGPGPLHRRGDAARGARSRGAAGAPAHPHPPRPRGRLGRALPALPGPGGVRARARRPAPDRPVQAPEERRAAVRGRHGAALGRGGAGRRGPRARPCPGGEVVEGFRVAYTPGHASHHVSYLHEATRRRLRGRRGRRARAAARVHRSAHAAARHRPGAVGGVAANARGVGPHGALPHPFRPARRRGRADRERPRGASRPGRAGSRQRRAGVRRVAPGAPVGEHERGRPGELRAGRAPRPALPGAGALLAQAAEADAA